MAGGKGGGSWKVAYADFVTAMMAFFLVMWIGAQDQKTRQSVANYFVDPSGVAKKPVQTGAVMDAVTYGGLPKEASVAMGKGRQSFDAPGELTPATRTVCNWIHQEDSRLKYWREKAQKIKMEAAANSGLTKENAAEAATRELSKQLSTEFTGEIPHQVGGIYQDLLIGAMNDVNWQQLAEDLLTQS